MANPFLMDIVRLFALGKFGDLVTGDKMREVVRIVGEHFKSLQADDPRADLARLMLLQLDPADFASLLRHHRMVQGTPQENEVVTNLAKLLPRGADNRLDETRASAILAETARLTDAEFEQLMDFLTHDPVAARIRAIMRGAAAMTEAFLPEFFRWIAVMDSRVEPYADDLAAGNRKTMTRINARRQAREARRNSTVARLGRGIANVLGRIF